MSNGQAKTPRGPSAAPRALSIHLDTLSIHLDALSIHLDALSIHLDAHLGAWRARTCRLAAAIQSRRATRATASAASGAARDQGKKPASWTNGGNHQGRPSW
eukprot:1167837-Prorocentrum_minimum.AAC.1